MYRAACLLAESEETGSIVVVPPGQHLHPHIDELSECGEKCHTRKYVKSSACSFATSTLYVYVSRIMYMCSTYNITRIHVL